MIDIH